MEIHNLMKPETQERIRYLLGKIRIEQRRTMTQFAEESGIALESVRRFITYRHIVGTKVLCAMAYIVQKYGYKLEE